ncbi:MAG: haloacid dehalogenase type II [Hyphomicrobiales bacterium]|nr:haloacid dehalogenase type II [Hyphomicrobiales bacterium]
MPRIFMFDAYGTLFDVHAAVARAGAPLGARAEALSALWRAKQLEYSWTMTLMGRAGEVDFWTLTGRALDFALARFAIDDPALLDAYAVLDAYPDVAPALAALKAAGHRTAIFTNGTRRMVEAAIAASGIGALLDHVITVEPTGRFKPDPAVYAHACAEAGAPPPRKIVFVSSNRWDVAAAAHAGFTPIWVNRSGQPAEYPGLEPAAVLPGLAGLDRLQIAR